MRLNAINLFDRTDEIRDGAGVGRRCAVVRPAPQGLRQPDHERLTPARSFRRVLHGVSVRVLGSFEPRFLAIGVLTGLVTGLGGLIALRFRSRLDLLAAFGGGAMSGVALFDLLPEALKIGQGVVAPLVLGLLSLAGFAGYLLLGRGLGAVACNGRRAFGPMGLVLHSVLDGFGVGLAAHISTAAGLLVAAAVVTHDVVDGANTVALSLSRGFKSSGAKAWLLADALAPLVGILLSALIAPSPATLAALLAIFTGFFLYIAWSELLPRAFAAMSRFAALLAAGSGFVLVAAISAVGAP